MSKHEFSYVTRTSKWIERQVLLDALIRFGQILDLQGYRYIGMGGIEFVDFRLIHRRLDITDMVSIDKATDERTQRRILQNRPLGCIRMKWGQSRHVLPRLELEDEKAIIWLDYESKLDLALRGEIVGAAQRLEPGSVLVVTINAHPESAFSERPDRAEERLGEEILAGYVQNRKSPASYSRQGLAKLQADVLRDSVKAGRYPDGDAALFLNLIYSDQAHMQTLAWVMTGEDLSELEHQVENIDWSGNAFVRDSVEDPSVPVSLNPPILTARERSELDSVLPAGIDTIREEVSDLGLKESWIDAYRQLYRYYPHYVQVAISA